MYERLDANVRASIKKYTRPGSAVGNAAALKPPIPQPTFKLASPATFPRRPTGHEVPRLMMTFWFGPPFKGPRLEAFNSLRRSVGVQLHLVTSDNLKQYILPGYPLHPAFEFLTPVLTPVSAWNRSGMSVRSILHLELLQTASWRPDSRKTTFYIFFAFVSPAKDRERERHRRSA